MDSSSPSSDASASARQERKGENKIPDDSFPVRLAVWEDIPAILALLPKEADRIELCGLVSNICVVSNAVVLQSHYPNAQIVVDANLTASFDPDLHEKTLDVLAGLQAEVLNRK